MSEIAFRTETGSVYVVDNVYLTWRRLRRTGRSGALRTEAGKLTEPVEVAVGQSAILFGPPFEPGLGPRLVITTPVVEILRDRVSGHAWRGGEAA